MKFETQLPKLSDQTVKLISKLSDDTREQVTKVVKTHLAACARNGSPIESLDRLFIEAVEIVKGTDFTPSSVAFDAAFEKK